MTEELVGPPPNIRIHDVVGGNVAWLEPLAALILEYFPETAGRISRLYERATRPRDADPRFIHYQWLIEVAGKAAGLACFSYVPARDLGLGICLAVRRDFRNLPVGGHTRLVEWLHEEILQQLASDAASAGRPAPWGLAVEVSVPALVAQYQRYGLLPLPVAYLEPRFRPCSDRDNPGEQEIVWEPAQLGLFPFRPAVEPGDPRFLRDVISAFYLDHYGFGAEQPEVQRVLQAGANAAESSDT